MTYNSIIVRYGEISLKGKNRRHFEWQLKKDIQWHFQSHRYPYGEISSQRGRLYIHGCQPVYDLHQVLGILSYSPAWEISCEYNLLVNAIPALYPFMKGKKSFRISCQRVNKRFVPDSPAVEREIGAIVHEATNIPVKLEKPDIDIHIEIGTHSIFLFFDKIKGFSGFPYGSAGKLVSLISGGIDSPVATFLMMKRGVEPILVHFQIWPDNTGEKDKMLRLKQKLEGYAAGREIKLYLINRDDIFAGKFAELYHSRHQPYICMICKYLMHRKATEIAVAEGALGLITGDNLAQVASQTLQNLYAQRFWSRLPVYSPLISFEKNDTIAIAKAIGTYEISIGYEKGCQPPASPKTSVTPGRLEKILRDTGFLPPVNR